MKSIELFAGAGGLGMGLHRADFQPLKVVEWDRDCCETIQENQGFDYSLVRSWPLFHGDIRSVDFTPFEDQVDLISGGPPCQPFSLGGKHRAHDDVRDMFPQAIRAVRETRPRAFVFENVKGLTRTSFRNYFEYIRLQLEHPELVAREDEDWTEHLERLDGLYPIDIDRALDASFDDCNTAARAAFRLKGLLPYTFRFASVSRTIAHPDLALAPVDLSATPSTARDVLTAIVGTLPSGWQLTVLKSHVILYKEDEHGYPDPLLVLRS